MLKITSRDNQKIKFARKVRDGKAGDFIFVEGTRLAEEVLNSNLKISDVLYADSYADSERGRSLLQKFQNSKLIEVSQSIFDSISDTKNSQGIIVLCEKPKTDKGVIEKNLLSKKYLPLVVLLHQTNNPSNLGAILRCCEAVNVAGVILTENSADAFSPKALRGAMGASLRIPIWTDADFFAVLDWAKDKNLISVCADINAKKNYLDIDWVKPRLLIFGSEAHGLSADERGRVDESLLIPMNNNVESLNLAVACGVVLFEAKRQIEK